MCVRMCFYRHVLFILNQLYCIQAVMGAPQRALWRPPGSTTVGTDGLVQAGSGAPLSTSPLPLNCLWTPTTLKVSTFPLNSASQKCLKHIYKQNKAQPSDTWINCTFLLLTQAPTDLHASLRTALTNPLWQQGKKDSKKRKRFDNMAHFPWEKFLQNATQLSLCGISSQFVDPRTKTWTFGWLLNTSGGINSRQKVQKECDGMRAITRRTNQSSSQTGWRSKRLWKKR